MGYFKYASVSALAIALSASAFAGPDLDTRVHDLEKQMKQVRTETASMTYGAETASARPSVVNGYNMFLSFDVLYFQPRVGGTEFAFTDEDPAAAHPIKGRVKEVDFKWDWGFRAGVGYNFDHGHWDVFANYTYFKSNTASMVTGDINGSVIPLKGSEEITDDGSAAAFNFRFANKATAEFKLDFDRIDLELGRNLYLSRNLSFRPHAGLVTAWINMKEVVRYSGGTDLGNNTVHVKDRNDFWGIGPRVGVNGKWHLTNGFSFMGDASGALVYGHYEVQHKNWFSAEPVNCKANLSANMHRFAPTAQIKLGLAYDAYIYNDKQHIGISLCWDTQYWWRMNQTLTTGESPNLTPVSRVSDDMSLQGVALNVKWDF
ncbi:MAG: hypothetical protein S4CHLAM37_00220 [Chlamydiia bacterium]|nr:hypothetical protein [Chlamydiia bacterium]